MNVSHNDANVLLNCDFSPSFFPSHPALSHEQINEKGVNLHHLDYTQTKSLIERFSRNFLKIGVHNARSLTKNIDNYRTLLENSELTVLAISESWLKPSITNKFVELQGYKIIRSDRCNKKKKRGGGVAFYVKSNVKFSVICKSDRDCDVDYLFIKLSLAKLVCGVVYKPPEISVSKLESVFNKISELYSTEANILVMGDFNVNMLLYDSPKTRCLVEHLNSLSFKLIDTWPTCHKSGCQSSVLDLVSGNCTGNISNVYQSSVGGISDHDLVCVDYRFKNSKAKPVEYWARDYQKINTDSFLSDLRNCCFDRIYYCSDVNEKLTCFNEMLFSTIDRHAPLKKKVARDPSYPWINNYINRMFKNRSEAYECWKKDKNNTRKWKNFTCLRNLTNREIKRVKREYFTSQLNADLPAKTLWKNIKRLGLTQTNTRMGGGDVNATTLNNYFVSHYTPVSFVENSDSTESHSEFSFRGVTCNEVLEEFATASCDSIGDDLIPLNILKISLPVTLPLITNLMNYCITCCEFPEAWKVAKVIPIEKVDNPTTENEFRPISILCALSKIFESILSKQLKEYLSNNNLLCPLQSGYRKSCSTVTALIKVENDIREALDKKMVTAMALLDFSKAFDTISHSLLCDKLKHNFKLDSLSVGLLNSYLSRRSQYVYFNNTTSDRIFVPCGVPQGSILGPLLFSMYINDLPLMLNYFKFHLYADDCQLYLSDSMSNLAHTIMKINSDIQRVLDWCKINGLVLNSKKTQAIIFCNQRTRITCAPKIKVGSDQIEYSDTVKNLGLIMDSKMSWKDQVNAVCNKVYKALHSLVAVRSSTPQHIRLLLARSLIVPIFDYGDVLYSLVSKMNLRKLQRAFNTVTRYVFNLSKYDHISGYANAILGVNFTSHLKLRVCTQTFKILNDPPVYLNNFFSYARSMRGPLLIVPRCSSCGLKDSFRHRAISAWNQLPRTCRCERNYNSFKNSVSSYFN